jgi:hypothetical protein
MELSMVTTPLPVSNLNSPKEVFINLASHHGLLSQGLSFEL